jgi:predicted metal-dependent peptidase
MIIIPETTDAQRLDLDRILVKVQTNARGFFVLFSVLDIVFSNEVKTACTNGKIIWFGNGFWDTLTQKERAFVLLHEVLHITLKHHLRRGDRHPPTFNRAADYVINKILVDMLAKNDSWLAIPKDLLFDSKYDGLNEYDVYRLLDKPDDAAGDDAGKPDDAAGKPDDDADAVNSANSSGQTWGGVIDGDDLGDAKAEAALDDIIQRAALIEQMSGCGAGGGPLESIAAAKARASKSLHSYLAKFFKANGDCSWSRPDRRMLSQGIALPGPVKNSVSDIVVAIDTSYSLERETLGVFLGVVQDLFTRSNFDNLHIVQFNDELYADRIFKRNEKISTKDIRGGGTNFQPAFDYAASVNAKALIMFTDGEASFPPRPSYSVCWALSQPCSTPYGVNIEL